MNMLANKRKEFTISEDSTCVSFEMRTPRRLYSVTFWRYGTDKDCSVDCYTQTMDGKQPTYDVISKKMIRRHEEIIKHFDIKERFDSMRKDKGDEKCE